MKKFFPNGEISPSLVALAGEGAKLFPELATAAKIRLSIKEM
jgi:hypothetical protein